MKFSEYLKEAKEKSPKDAIVQLFTNNSKVTDEDVHTLADKMGIDKHKFEEIIYGLLTSFFNKGKYNSKKSVKIDEKELKLGIKVEMEHTDDVVIAERIAKDHLAEIPGTGNNDGYYSLLERMEAGVYD
jgi:3-hydroxyisobutyrate dehydrogenase-like beta-hydroxyacid dehydrogenase